MKHPENTSYVVVRRPPPSIWRQGAKLAAILAIIQAVLSGSNDIAWIAFSVAATFLVYWVFFAFLVWLWRAVRKR